MENGEQIVKFTPPRPSPLFFLLVTWIRETLEAALMEYNAANAVMDLVLFDEVRAMLLHKQYSIHY